LTSFREDNTAAGKESRLPV